METHSIVLTIKDAQKVADNLSDLLCWWQGFKTGLKMSGDENTINVAENGITQTRELRLLIGDKLRELNK